MDFFFFFDMSAQEGVWGIRTSNHHFIKCGPSRLSYLLGTKCMDFICNIFYCLNELNKGFPNFIFFSLFFFLSSLALCLYPQCEIYKKDERDSKRFFLDEKEILRFFCLLL
jgi:hypothetical protein